MTYLPTHTVKEGPDYQVLATGLIFHGSVEDLFRLAVAIEHNCELRAKFGSHTTAFDAKSCPVHGIAFNQRELNGLAWMRRFKRRLDDEEWTIDGKSARPPYPEGFEDLDFAA